MILWLLACSDPAPPEPAPTPGVEVQAPPSAPSEPVPDTIVLRHILVGFDGSLTQGVSGRSRAEARAVLEDARARILAGEDFASLAGELSDEPGGRQRGGWLGAATRDAYVPSFSEAAWTLQEGEVSGIVETEFGLHLIKREPLVETELRQILVQHAKVPRVWLVDKQQSRTRPQARQRAEDALSALESGQDFAQVAREFSDGPMASYGGELGSFLQGELGPAFDAQVEQLEPGERSPVFETDGGFHILERLP